MSRSAARSLPYMVTSRHALRLPASPSPCQPVAASPTGSPAAGISAADWSAPQPLPPPSAQTAGRGRRRELTQGVLASLPHLTSRHKPSGEDINSRFRVGGIKIIITKPDRMCSVFKWHWGPKLANSSDGSCSLAGLTQRQSQLEPQRLCLQTHSGRLLQIRLSMPISFPIKAILSQFPLRRSLFCVNQAARKAAAAVGI